MWDKLTEVFIRFGFPAELIKNISSYFTAKVFVDTCAAFGIKNHKTTTYHPQANSTERINQNLKPLLTAFAQQHRDRNACLNEIGFSLRSTVNRSTGYTPAFLNFGKELPNPMDRVLRGGGRASAAKVSPSGYAVELCSRMDAALHLARSNLAKVRAGQKAQYDRSHRNVRYDVGDLILRRNHVLSDAVKGISASLSAKWLSPYRMHSKVSPLVYKLADSQWRPAGGPVNVSDLKPFVARSNDSGEGEAVNRTTGKPG
ncbi:uncharacterized protein LOC142767845 [Rhipicephalus microplus]|uniref:uncharacterized protein LOC142767845 n=1 Tax=Rhipicephalus microplus TaxID=6941 RepID=UPI003F6A683D